MRWHLPVRLTEKTLSIQGVGTKPDLVGSEADASLGITRRSPPRIPGVVCDHGTGWSDAAVVLDGAPSWLGIPTKWMVGPTIFPQLGFRLIGSGRGLRTSSVKLT